MQHELLKKKKKLKNDRKNKINIHGEKKINLYSTLTPCFHKKKFKIKFENVLLEEWGMDGLRKIGIRIN